MTLRRGIWLLALSLSAALPAAGASIDGNDNNDASSSAANHPKGGTQGVDILESVDKSAGIKTLNHAAQKGNPDLPVGELKRLLGSSQNNGVNALKRDAESIDKARRWAPHGPQTQKPRSQPLASVNRKVDAATTPAAPSRSESSWLPRWLGGGSGGQSDFESSEPSGGPAPAPGGDASPASENTRNEQRAFAKAQSMANGFKNSLPSVETVPDGAAPQPTAAWTPTGASGDPAHPRADADLRLAGMSGFRASYDALGLKLVAGKGAAPAIVDQSGRPASQAQLAALRRQISADPEALMRYPDLFKTVPRARFERLKTEYETRPALQQTLFQDVGLTDGRRDFEWTRSCENVSGDCNRHAASQSYQKGEKVSPRDLDKLWKDLEDEARNDDLAQGGAAPRPSLRLGLKGLSLGEDFDGREPGERGGDSGAAATLASAAGWLSGRGWRRTADARPGLAPTGPRAAEVPLGPLGLKSRGRGLGALAAVGAGGLLLGFLLLRRKDDGRRRGP